MKLKDETDALMHDLVQKEQELFETQQKLKGLNEVFYILGDYIGKNDDNTTIPSKLEQEKPLLLEGVKALREVVKSLS